MLVSQYHLGVIDDLFKTKNNPEYQRRYYAGNRERLLANNKNNYDTLKNELKLILGTQCALCGSTDFEFLEIDHIHSNGAQQRKLFNGHKTEWRYYRNHPSEAREQLQLLCPTCNKKKKKEKNEVPYRSRNI